MSPLPADSPEQIAEDQAALEGFKAWLDLRRERLNNTWIMVDAPGTVKIIHLERNTQ